MISDTDESKLWDTLNDIEGIWNGIRGAAQALMFRVETGSGDLEDNFYEFVIDGLMQYADTIENAYNDMFEIVGAENRAKLAEEKRLHDAQKAEEDSASSGGDE